MSKGLSAKALPRDLPLDSHGSQRSGRPPSRQTGQVTEAIALGSVIMTFIESPGTLEVQLDG